MKKTIYTVIATVYPDDNSPAEDHALGSFDTYEKALERMISLRETIRARLLINLSFED